MPKVNWLAVRTAYVVKGWSAAKCAEEFGVNETTVKKRASAEGWTQERHRLNSEATAVATEQLAGQAAIVIDSIREDHAKIVRDMHGVLAGIHDDLAQITNPRTRIVARKEAAEAFQVVLKSSRLVLGITDGQASMATTESADRKIIFEEAEVHEAAAQSA